MLPEQHGCPAPPQAVHLLVLVEQMLLLLLHTPPVQHVWPAPPQGVHWLAEHRNPLEHMLPVQQGCPEPPHVPQVPLEQASVGKLHLLFAQQGCPEPPQVAHLLVASQISVVEPPH